MGKETLPTHIYNSVRGFHGPRQRAKKKIEVWVRHEGLEYLELGIGRGDWQLELSLVRGMSIRKDVFVTSIVNNGTW